MTVSTLEKTASSTSVDGRAFTPGVVLWGGRMVKVLHTVVNGGASRWAQIRLVPAAQDGPPQKLASALPSLSRNTSNDWPVPVVAGGGVDHDSRPRQRLLSSSAVIVTRSWLKTGLHSTPMTPATLDS